MSLMKYLVRLLVVALMVAFVFAKNLIPSDPQAGEIVSLSQTIESPLPHKIAEVAMESKVVRATIYQLNLPYKVGDMVIVGHDPQFEDVYSVTDKVRTLALYRLFILFVIAIVAVSGIAGVRSLFGLAFSFAVIFMYVLPQIVGGSNPVSVALIASAMILLVSYYLSHGLSRKSTIAILGTLGALMVTGILASLFGSWAGLTGFGAEETGFLLDKFPVERFYNLLLAGIIIGSLGVLDDITISQAAIVSELADSNPKLGMQDLYLKAMRIGHDHISSLVNTLVLVYAGSSLPLLLLFVTSRATPFELLNYEAMAEEIVRTLAGSIGLITAVPMTTLIASYWYSKKS